MKSHFKSVSIAFSLIISLGLNAENPNYINNKAPLAQTPFTALPVGAVKAEGWLLTQLELQKNGLTGYSETIYHTATELGTNCDWLGGTGDSWERAPYYVKGLVALAYTLNDETLKTRAKKWIDWSVDNQQSNGFFGPVNNRDWWARMPMLYAIRDYYEATNDARIIPFFTKYFQYQLNNIDSQPLSSWGRSRAGDNIEIVFWLYNRTGENFLLTLADKLKNQAYDWTDIFTNNRFMAFGTDFQPKHNVNIPQAMKMPAIYYQKSQLPADRDAYKHGHEHLMCDHGQPSGMQSGHEMVSGRSAMTGMELCSVVEQMQTCETSQMILGHVSIGDQLEKVAFNALPGGISKDFKGLQYYTQANQVKSKFGDNNFGQEYNNGLLPGPFSGYQCCRFNLHMGWPYFVKNMWAATPDNGLAAMSYGPNTVTAKVGNAKTVQINVATQYPFDETINMTITMDSEETFPLKLRIPAWCKNPQVEVNNVAVSNVTAGEFLSIQRSWKNGDLITLKFPMHIIINEEVNNSVSVQRGPLVYSLKIGEQWNMRTDYGNGFKEFEVLPTTAWNYAFSIDCENPGASFTVNKNEMPANPYLQATTPVTLSVKARKLPTWTYALNNMFALDPPYGPVTSTAQEETLTLVPYGAENIRLTCLPVLGTPAANASTFTDDFNDGNQIGWVNYNGSFMVENGEYVSTNVEGRPGSKSVQSSTQFADFTYDADLKVNENGDGGLIFRASKLSLGADEYFGYYAGISASGKSVILGKGNGGWTQLRSVSMNIQPNQWYKMRITTKGNLIKIFVDDMATAKITLIDNSYTTGHVGVRSYNAITRWDNLSVTSAATAVKDLRTADNIRLYPNPAKNYLDVAFDNDVNNEFLVSMLSMNGSLLFSKIKEKNVASVRFDTSQLAKGTYLLSISSDDNACQARFIKE